TAWKTTRCSPLKRELPHCLKHTIGRTRRAMTKRDLLVSKSGDGAQEDAVGIELPLGGLLGDFANRPPVLVLVTNHESPMTQARRRVRQARSQREYGNRLRLSLKGRTRDGRAEEGIALAVVLLNTANQDHQIGLCEQCQARQEIELAPHIQAHVRSRAPEVVARIQGL